jgi:UDP-glucose 4-epimerase
LLNNFVPQYNDLELEEIKINRIIVEIMEQEKLEGKKVVVTGAAGFIGSHIVDALLATGNEIIGIDNFYNGRQTNVADALKNPQFKLIRADIRDYDCLLEQFRGVDVVYHEAAFTSVPQSVVMPQACNQVNVDGVLNVLNAARRNDVGKVLFASSSAVYGDTPTLPKHEDMPTVPISPYGVSKLAGEMYFRTYYKVYGLNTTCLRYFNVFGPRQRDSPYSGVIAIWFGRIARGEPLVVFGDGSQSRDFTYVKDVVEANIRAALVPEAAGQVFNIAAGSPITVDELANTVLEITGHADIEIQHLDARPGDILHSFGDMTRAREILNFEPRYSVKSGMEDYLAYLDENLEEK